MCPRKPSPPRSTRGTALEGKNPEEIAEALSQEAEARVSGFRGFRI